MALPGGAIFIPASLFLNAADEAEFAGMLAHAMEHVAQRHGARQATANNMANIGSIPLILMGGRVSSSEGQAIPRSLLARLRNDELEADALAVQALAHAGFDPAALRRYFERDRPVPPGIQSQVFSPLPERGERIAALDAAIARLPQTTYREPAAEFAAIRAEVIRLTPPPDGHQPAFHPAEPSPDRPTLKRAPQVAPPKP